MKYLDTILQKFAKDLYIENYKDSDDEDFF